MPRPTPRAPPVTTTTCAGEVDGSVGAVGVRVTGENLAKDPVGPAGCRAVGGGPADGLDASVGPGRRLARGKGVGALFGGTCGGAMRARTRAASPVSLEYLPALDGIRAVAVVAVIATHTVATIPGGFLSVDVFFALSGYLITSLLIAEWRQSDTISLGSVLVAPGPAPAPGPVPDAHRRGRRARRCGRRSSAAPRCGATRWRRCSTSPTGTSSPTTPITSSPRARPPRCCTPGRWPSRSSSTWCGRSWSWPCSRCVAVGPPPNAEPRRGPNGVDETPGTTHGAGAPPASPVRALRRRRRRRGGLGAVDGGADPRRGRHHAQLLRQ